MLNMGLTGYLKVELLHIIALLHYCFNILTKKLVKLPCFSIYKV